jgi:cytochrome c oxidase subunit 2
LLGLVSALAIDVHLVFAQSPANWQTGFGVSASETKARIVALHDHILLIGVCIVVLVAVLIGFALIRFRSSRHPTASKVTRMPWLEFGWTVAPVLVLGAIAAPSLQLLAYESDIPVASLTVKVSGHQWFWRYSYPDNGGIAYDSIMLPPAAVPAGEPRLLAVDNRMVVPVGAVVRIQVTSSDVVHSFFMPALGLQIYAIPGRLNETWTRVDKPGIYYGQCNQICGLNHSFMPIVIEAMAQADFESWARDAAARYPVVSAAAPNAVTAPVQAAN